MKFCTHIFFKKKARITSLFIQNIYAIITEYENEIADMKGQQKCPSCGAVVKNDMNFCAKCGAKVNEEEEASESRGCEAKEEESCGCEEK